MALDDAGILAVAGRLVREIGRAAPVSLTPLEGGRNNRVFRLVLTDGSALALKSYFFDEHDPRDRLAAEWGFLRYAWARGARAIPEPLACDGEAHIGLYGFLEGRKLGAAEISAGHIAAATDFVIAVNAAPREILALPPGSEACFSLAGHLATVERRVARLAALDPKAPHRGEAETFITSRLAPAWEAVKASARRESRALGLAAEEELMPSVLCLSPSDFGFHNALADGTGRLSFIDFEYAGRDDPAKLVCDFFCQPEIPAPPDAFEPFLARVVSGLGLPQETALRSRLLRDAYRVKWIAIMLNDFLPAGAARRAFANTGAREARCARQLNTARDKIADLSVS